MTTDRMTYEDMEARLDEAESIIGALRNQQVDAIVGEDHIALVRLREVEEALRQAKVELEQRVKERTAELAEAQRRLLKAQQIAHVGNWEWDPRSGALWWSDEACRLFGIEPGQVQLNYEVFLAFVHRDDRERVADTLRDVVDNKQPRIMEFRIVRPDGQERYIYGETEIALDSEGNVARLMGVTRDLTESRQRQEQLERYTAQLREQAELLDLAHDMIFVHDMEGRIIFWNRGAERCYGWTREEALGRLSHQLLQTEYSEPQMRITARIIRDGWWEGELTHTTRDGGKVMVATRWALRRGPGARPVAILEIDNDITERKRAEQEMAEARRFAESIVDTIQEALVVLNSHLRVVSANRCFYEWFDLTPEQVADQFFLMLHGGRWDVPELRDGFRKVLSQDAGFEGIEVECEHGPEGPRMLLFSARPVRGQTPAAGLILLVIQDITAVRRQEREIQTDKQQLACLTEELMLTEERQRRQMAQALRDSVGESLARIRQELGVLGEENAGAIREQLHRICGQVDRAIESTRNLAVELSPSTLYQHGLKAAIGELAEQFTDCEGFVCRVQATEEPVPVPAQVSTMLYRAVRELLVNVARHAQAGNVQIDVSRDGQRIRISVEDDGRGFDPSRLNSQRAQGSFGLHSIRERLTRIDGELTIDSVEGRGTRVTLTARLDPDYEPDRDA